MLILNHNVRERGTYFRAWKMAEGFRDRGDAVTFCTTGEQYYRTRQKRTEGITVLETPSLSIAHGPDGGWLPLAVCSRVYHVLTSKRYDLVFTFSHKPVDAVPAILSRLVCKSLWIGDWCDLWGGEGLNGLMKTKRGPAKTLGDRWSDLIVQLDAKLERHTARSADGLTVISRDLEARAKALRGNAERITLLPSGADTERIPVLEKSASRKEFNLPQGVPLLGYMTSWYPDEEFTLQALRQVLRERSDAAVAIAGPPLGNQEQVLSEQPFTGRVFHCGRLPFAQVPAFLGACDLLLMPLEDSAFNRSRWPNKIGDYLAAGRPQVACAVGDVGPFFEHAAAQGNAVGIKTEASPKAFAEGILNLLNSPEQWNKLGANARHYAETHRSWARIRADFFEWVERLEKQ